MIHRIDCSSILLNPIETAARLKTPLGYTDENIIRCEKELRNAADCRYCFNLVDVCYPEKGFTDLGFGSFKSDSLYRHLGGAKQAYIFALTLGIEVDRLILRLESSSTADRFITDALASALVEAACDAAEKTIFEGTDLAPAGYRFSAGYGDFPLDLQPKILGSINAGRLLGITLSRSMLMIPRKSVTAVIPIKHIKGISE